MLEGCDPNTSIQLLLVLLGLPTVDAATQALTCRKQRALCVLSSMRCACCLVGEWTTEGSSNSIKHA
jgi:hypothetical protein